ISPRLRVGGPATAANEWLADFDRFCAANACPPDFISTHYYPTDAFGSILTDTVSQLADAPASVMRHRGREAAVLHRVEHHVEPARPDARRPVLRRARRALPAERGRSRRRLQLV